MPGSDRNPAGRGKVSLAGLEVRAWHRVGERGQGSAESCVLRTGLPRGLQPARVPGVPPLKAGVACAEMLAMQKREMDAVMRPFQAGEGVTIWATVLVGGYRGRRWSGVACVLL